MLFISLPFDDGYGGPSHSSWFNVSHITTILDNTNIPGHSYVYVANQTWNIALSKEDVLAEIKRCVEQAARSTEAVVVVQPLPPPAPTMEERHDDTMALIGNITATDDRVY
jgi:hypothetical protein